MNPIRTSLHDIWADRWKVAGELLALSLFVGGVAMLAAARVAT